MTNWDDMRLLLELARTGSFLRTGDALGLAPSTVSRRIAGLEADLGATLVERSPDGCRLTARGRSLAELAAQTARGLDHFRMSSAGGLSGPVTVTTGDGFMPAVNRVAARFLSAHPEVRLELLVEQDFRRLGRGEADIAIRTEHLGEPALVYRRLGAIRYGIFRAPELAPGAGGDWPLLSLLSPYDRAPQMQALAGAGLGTVVWRGSSFAALLSAAQAGVGIAALPLARAGGLVPVAGAPELPEGQVFLVTRASARHEPQIAGFARALAEGIREELGAV